MNKIKLNEQLKILSTRRLLVTLFCSIINPQSANITIIKPLYTLLFT